MAELYEAQGRYTDAEPLMKRALAITEKALGPEHPDVGACLDNLAALYVAQARYTDAEPLYKRALDIVEKALPVGHPDIARSPPRSLAELYEDQGRYDEAEPLIRRRWASVRRRSDPSIPLSASASITCPSCTSRKFDTARRNRSWSARSP